MAVPSIPIHVSVVLRDPRGAVLLVQEGDPADQRAWNLPGGHVERGETLRAAALREALEETGLTVTLTGLCGIYTFIQLPQRHSLRFVFYADGEGETRPGEDILAARYFTLEEIQALPDAALTNPPLFRRILADAQSGRVLPLETLSEMEEGG